METRTINLLNKYNLNHNLEEELKSKTVYDLLKIKGIGPVTITDWASTSKNEIKWDVYWSVLDYQDAQRLKYNLTKAKREYKHRKFMFIKYGIKTDILINNIESEKEIIQAFCEYHPELAYMFKL